MLISVQEWSMPDPSPEPLVGTCMCGHLATEHNEAAWGCSKVLFTVTSAGGAMARCGCMKYQERVRICTSCCQPMNQAYSVCRECAP